MTLSGIYSQSSTAKMFIKYKVTDKVWRFERVGETGKVASGVGCKM